MKRFQHCPWCAGPLEEVVRDGFQRRVCVTEGCGFVHWNNPVPVVAAIVERDDGVVLVRNKGWPAKWYGIVSGFLEAGEDPAEGILREIAEEIGLSATIVELVGLYPFAAMNQLLVVYHVEAAGAVELGEEIADYKVVSVEKLKPWAIGTGPAVRDWLAKRLA